MPTKKNTPKNKPIKRTINNCYVSYIPHTIRTLGITRTYLDDAIGCYLEFRKEPEKLLTRNLNSDWNFHMFREAVCKVVSIESRHDLDFKTYQTTYETLENTGLKLPDWYPHTWVYITEYAYEDNTHATANIHIINEGHEYTYESERDRWIAQFERRPIHLPKEPFTKLQEIPQEGVQLGSGLALTLTHIHYAVKQQHPEFA